MIQKMNSGEFNKIFKSAQDKTLKFEQELIAIKKDINSKIKVIRYEEEYISQVLSIIDSGMKTSNNITGFLNNSYGVFNSYGHTVHPKFNKTPIDIFNLRLPSGDNYFKQHIIAKVNDIEREEYTNILMADNNANKEIVFNELDSQNIKLEFSLKNEFALGTMRFNTIEIDPYLLGSYDLLSIEIYSMNDAGEINSSPTYTVSGYNGVAKSRIILPNKYKFSKVIFNFKANFKVENNLIDIYPFGLKHIHFYEADYQETSFVIAEFHSDNFIEYVNNDLTLYSISGAINTTADKYNIEVFTDYINNTLIGKVNLSSDENIFRLATNTKKLYIKIPLLKIDIENNKEYLSLNGIKINIKTNEEVIL